MTDRPILFSAPMVRALQDGKKTQTRRLAWRVFRAPLNDWDKPWRKPTIWQKVEPGDRLWVRETWHTHAMFDDLPPREITARSVHYAADGPAVTGKTRVSIHMPRWASRLTLVVTEAKMKRLQQIDGIEALREGITRVESEAPWRTFKHLWESLHTKPGNRWEDNPEIVALTYSVHKANIDRMGQDT